MSRTSGYRDPKEDRNDEVDDEEDGPYGSSGCGDDELRRPGYGAAGRGRRRGRGEAQNEEVADEEDGPYGSSGCGDDELRRPGYGAAERGRWRPRRSRSCC